MTLKDTSDTLWLVPIHASLTIDGELLMFGFSRTTGDFDPTKADVSPTFLMKPDLYTDVDTIARAQIFGAVYDGDGDSFVCAGHTFLADGRLVVVGGTRIAKKAKTAAGADREFGLNYGGIFGETGWARIPRDFLAGEAWYPSLVRLSDGRLLMYSGYYELEGNDNGALLSYNRAMQFFDSKSADDPWTLLSSSADTPQGTEPTNYTWIYELPKPINAGGKDRQLFVMGRSGATFLLNHVDPFTDPKARFVARTPRPAPPGVEFPSGAATVMLTPYFHEAEKLFYRPGSILAIGGSTNDATAQQFVDIYDPYVDKWCRAAKPLGIRRKNSVGVHLPDGNVLIVNGEPSEANTPRPKGVPKPPVDKDRLIPQIFDPRTGAIASGKAEPLADLREYHNVAILVPDGRIFVAGGRSLQINEGDPDERSDAHFYSPYYLGILPPSDRPQVVGIPKDPVMHYAGDYVVDYKNGEITGAALVAIGSVTHSTDFNGRYIELDLRGGGKEPRGNVTLRGPEDGRIAPPGHYMLFLLRKVRGVSVPSVAQIVRVDGLNPSCEGAPINACGGCRVLMHLPGAACHDVCGAGSFKCDGPNKTSCNACL